jgi:hypothetical protein
LDRQANSVTHLQVSAHVLATTKVNVVINVRLDTQTSRAAVHVIVIFLARRGKVVDEEYVNVMTVDNASAKFVPHSLLQFSSTAVVFIRRFLPVKYMTCCDLPLCLTRIIVKTTSVKENW